MRSEEADEQFYRDTESIAFPALNDEQVATLESLGERRSVKRGEIVYKAGQRDVPFNLVLSGELEVFESRDGEEQILGVPGPRDFVGDISMLTGTAVIATVRGKAEETEIVQIPAARFRRALAEIPSVSEAIVKRADHATQTSATRSGVYRSAHSCSARFARRPSARRFSR